MINISPVKIKKKSIISIQIIPISTELYVYTINIVLALMFHKGMCTPIITVKGTF